MDEEKDRQTERKKEIWMKRKADRQRWMKRDG